MRGGEQGDKTGGEGFLFHPGKALHPVKGCEKLTNTRPAETKKGGSKTPNKLLYDGSLY